MAAQGVLLQHQHAGRVSQCPAGAAAAALSSAPLRQAAWQHAPHPHACSHSAWAARLRRLQAPQHQQQRRLAALPPEVAAVAAGGGGGLEGALYGVSQQMDLLVQQELTGLTPLSLGVVLLAGLLTSLSPCTLSVLPLTIGYIGGYSQASNGSGSTSESSSSSDGSSSSEPNAGTGEASGSAAAVEGSGGGISTATAARQEAPTAASSVSGGSSGGSSSGSSLGLQAASFSAGLATTLALLGVASSMLGQAYGTGIGQGLPLLVALVAISMGLNLLEVLPLRLPSLDVGDVRRLALPPPATAYLAGMTFALAASPCSTPVLATLLGYVSATHDPLTGGVLLLAYSCGYVAPLLVAASATGAAKRVLSLRQYSGWITPASGVLLVAGGTYALLSRLVPV